MCENQIKLLKKNNCDLWGCKHFLQVHCSKARIFITFTMMHAQLHINLDILPSFKLKWGFLQNIFMKKAWFIKIKKYLVVINYGIVWHSRLKRESLPGSIPSVFGESRGAKMATFWTVTWLFTQKNSIKSVPNHESSTIAQ